MLRSAVVALIAGCIAEAAIAQESRYIDATSPKQAVGMMVVTARTAGMMETECGKRFSDTLPAIRSSMQAWRQRDGRLADAAESEFATAARAHASLQTQVDEALDSIFQARFVTPYVSVDAATRDRGIRARCETYFGELASGVWRQRTPNVYKYLEGAR